MYRRALTTVLLVALTITAMAPVAGADQISDKRKQAAALAARLDDLQTRAEQLAEDYDEARYRAGQLDEQITQVSAVLDANRARIDEVEGRLGGWAVRAYVGATSTDPVLAMFQSGDPSLTFAGYAAIAVGADAELGDELRQSREDVTALEDELARAREDQQAEQEALASKKSAAEAAVRRSEGVLAGIQSDLAQLVAQEQRRLALEEQRRVQARLAAAAAARQKTVAGTNRVRASAPPPSPAEIVPLPAEPALGPALVPPDAPPAPLTPLTR